MSDYFAIFLSSGFIVIFGEILPQAICVKKGLEICAKTIWITKFIIFIFYPISYPIGKLLDKIVGKEYISYNRQRVIELIKMTACEEKSTIQEFKIAEGAMKMKDKVVSNIMTKIDVKKNIYFIN